MPTRLATNISAPNIFRGMEPMKARINPIKTDHRNQRKRHMTSQGNLAPNIRPASPCHTDLELEEGHDKFPDEAVDAGKGFGDLEVLLPSVARKELGFRSGGSSLLLVDLVPRSRFAPGGMLMSSKEIALLSAYCSSLVMNASKIVSQLRIRAPSRTSALVSWEAPGRRSWGSHLLEPVPFGHQDGLAGRVASMIIEKRAWRLVFPILASVEFRRFRTASHESEDFAGYLSASSMCRQNPLNVVPIASSKISISFRRVLCQQGTSFRPEYENCWSWVGGVQVFLEGFQQRGECFA